MFGGTGGGGGGMVGFGGQPSNQGQMMGGGFGGGGGGQPGGAGLFGSTPAMGGGGGNLFGGSNLFGQTPSNNATPFGARPQAPAGGLFGQPAAAAPQTAAGSGLSSLFGQPTQQQQPTTAAAGGSLFGPSPSPFSAQQPASNLFGGAGATPSLFQTPSNNLAGGGMNSTSTSLFGAPSMQMQQQQQQQPLSQPFQSNAMFQTPRPPLGEPSVEDLLRHLMQRVTERSDGYQMVHMFYKLEDGRLVGQYGPQADWHIPGHVWDQAVMENPDSSRLVPVPAFGFKDLRKRVEWVEKGTRDHADAILEQRQRLDELARQHDLAIQEGIEARTADLRKIIRRVLVLVGRMEVLKHSGYSLSYSEEVFRQKLEHMLTELRRPAQFRGRLHELRSTVDMQDYAERDSTSQLLSVDAKAADQLTSYLSKQQAGLELLVNQISSDSEQLQTLLSFMNSTK